jgi:hypothetical protein
MSFFYNLNKTLDAIREKPETTNKQLNEGAVAEAGYSAKDARAGKDIGKPGKQFAQIAKSAGEKYGSKERGEKVAGAVLNKLRGKTEEGVIPPEMNKPRKSDVPAYARKAAGQGPLSLDDLRAEKLRNISHRDTLAKNRDVAEEGGEPMTPKQKSFAKLAPPVDKITFADKIAGAKKEVDEMLGDVAAEAMKAALGKGKKVVADEDYGPMEEGFGEWEPDELEVGQSKKSSSGGTITKTKTGIRHIGRDRTDDPETEPAPGEKRGRGRPKSGAGPRQERVTAKSRKTDRTTHGQAGYKKAVKEEETSDDCKAAIALLKKNGYKVSKAEQELDEKAVSKKQQKFMGMVHAAQKGEKPASKEVAKVAKEMPKKAAKDFAATKHKGLPEKAKSKKKEEEVEESSTTAGSVAPAPAKAAKGGGFGFGKGIYDSFNRDVEAMISESMNISMSVNSDEHGGPRQTLTINATDEDALKLGALLKAAGLGGGEQSGSCGCGSTPCSCNDAQAVDENAPDYPTDQVEADSNLEYSGGMNGPKSTGQTTVPVIAGQDERMGVDGDDELRRIREMAGIKEAKKPDFLDVDKDGDKKEAFKKAAKDKEENKVKESIFDLTNQWKAYKG